MSEKDFAKKVMTYLKTIPDMHPIRIEPSTYGGMKGVSDIIACYKGKFIAIELKIPGNRPTRLQEHFHKKIRSAGGIAEVCYSLGEVEACLKNA